MRRITLKDGSRIVKSFEIPNFKIGDRVVKQYINTGTKLMFDIQSITSDGWLSINKDTFKSTNTIAFERVNAEAVHKLHNLILEEKIIINPILCRYAQAAYSEL